MDNLELAPEEILSALIKINTTNPPGNELEAALFLKRLFNAAGISGEIIEAAPGRASFLATLGPKDPAAKRLLFLSHLDVVPPGSGWSFDPFGGEIKNGFVLGRGALDCKDMVAAQAAAFLVLAREQKVRPLGGSLIFAAVADEEKGGRYGIQHLLRHHRAKIAADFVVNEGAEEPLRVRNECIYFIQTGEKGLAWSTLKARGTAAHGSLPGLGRNAIVAMAGAVKNLGSYRPEIVLLPEVNHLINTLARLRGQKEQVTPANLDSFFAAWEDRGFAATLHAMTRLTMSPNVIRGGVKTNVIPDSCEVDVDIRVLPGQDRAYVFRELRRCAGKEIEIEMPNFRPPSFSPISSPYYQFVEEAIKEVHGKATCLPMISPGATDSRFLREAGFPCYGVAVLAPDFPPELRTTIHAADERIDIKSLRYFTMFFVTLARKYLG
ncbi:MAG: M20/M25/M40 family metallo-hydrolase [Bacillota bacterium]|nr:M20/M25/M40 family metallo-hydrolase [Bacillota bacterium]